MPAASSPTAARRADVISRLRRFTTSRRSRTTSTRPSSVPSLSRSGAAESATGTRRSGGLELAFELAQLGLAAEVDAGQERLRAGDRAATRAARRAARARLGLATRMRPSGVASATPSGIDSRIGAANAVGASTEKPKRCMLQVISAPNTAKDATPRRGNGMPSSGSRPSVVEPISSGMPIPAPSHGLWPRSAGDPVRPTRPARRRADPGDADRAGYQTA